MNIDIIRIPDAVLDGSFVWAKMGFYTKDINKVKDCVKRIMDSDIDDNIKQKCRDALETYKADFPLQEITFDETKEILSKYKWNCFIDLRKKKQVKRLKDYLEDKMKKIEF